MKLDLKIINLLKQQSEYKGLIIEIFFSFNLKEMKQC